MMYTREDKAAHLRNSNADWVPKLKIPKPFLPQTEDTPPISQEPAPAPVSGAHGLKGGFMGIPMGVVGFLAWMEVDLGIGEAMAPPNFFIKNINIYSY